MTIRSLGVLCAALGASSVATAQGLFLPATDIRLRDDITLLADSHLIDLPINEWPLAREDVARAIAAIDADTLPGAALRAALQRVMAKTAVHENAAEWKMRIASLTAGQPALLREFDTLGREHGELTISGGASTDRYTITIAATGALDASDGQRLRLDGSDLGLRWGNWLIGINQIDRWWGPGYGGSLILSSNARPMPALSLARIRSLPFDAPVLRWFGPWRFTTFFGLGEPHRPDVDRPLFMGMRLSFKPATWAEFGLSRSAQFCGSGRECNLGTFGRMLIGRDNLGLRGSSNDPAKEPGNQMSGYDLRIAPFGTLPVALYGQVIGEDNSDISLPIRYLYLAGAQAWRAFGNGTVLRGYIEHTDTSTGLYLLWKIHDRAPGFRTDYAYRNHLYFAGYRYRGRNIGHTTDGDSETTVIGLSLTGSGGNRLAMQWRGGRLDRRGAPDIYDPVTLGPSRYRSLQLRWDGNVIGQEIGVQIGHERQSPASAGKADGVFGFLQWRKALD